MTIEEVRPYLIYEVIAGSKAYGLDLPTSDTDIRGIYMLPNEFLLGKGYSEQINNTTSDIVYYELNRFVHLLEQNNPNILEELFVPKDKILFMSPKIKLLYDNKDKFLTTKCRNTFGGYSISQIKKARGLNKKIVNPIDKERKTPLDFCYIFEKEDGYTMLAKQWLDKHKKKQEFCGLAELPNGEQIYKVYYDYLAETKNENPRYADIETHNFRGIELDESNQLRHSEIPKGLMLEGFLYYNLNGYSQYCKEYKEYWEWVEKRNPVRYNDNAQHGKGYDGKNLMHCLRMLDMAIEVAQGKGINLVRPNREWLLSVRRGEASYEEIIGLIEQKKVQMDEAFERSELPTHVNPKFVHNLLIEMRNPR
jgi:predicted nucleotidyltransferase